MPQSRSLYQVLLTSTLAALICSSVLIPNYVEAQRLTWKQRLEQLVAQIFSKKNPKRQKRNIGISPGNRTDGGSRDRCPPVKEALTALVPADETGATSVETTISGRPIFWFFIPYGNESLMNKDNQIEFMLIDDNENEVYAATFPRPLIAGMVSLQLPETSPPLQEGKLYQWVFSVICNPNNRAGDVTVNGWIQKISLSSETMRQIQAASPEERILSYAANGLWYETIATLANLQQQPSKNADQQEAWRALLQAIGLSKLSSKPFVPCYQSMMCVQTRGR